MAVPLTYRIAGTSPDGNLVLHLVATSRNAAYSTCGELWPGLRITSLTLLEEWSDADPVGAEGVAA